MADEEGLGVEGVVPSSDTVRERLHAAAAAASASVQFSEALAGEVPAPGRGQFWRARWEDVVTAVLLLGEPADGRVEAAAVTFDTDLADGHAFVAPAGSATLGVDAVVWVGDAEHLPVAVLDRYMGALTKTPDVLNGPWQTWFEQRPQTWAHTNTTVQARLLRASVVDDMHALAAASWVPQPVGDLASLLKPVKVSTLADALGVSTGEALHIKRGDRPLTLSEAHVLGPLVGVDPAALEAAVSPLPPEVVEVFDEPAVRAQVVELAQRRGVTETVARRRFAYEAVASAARATGDRREAHAQRQVWRQRIAQYFDVQLAEDSDW